MLVVTEEDLPLASPQLVTAMQMEAIEIKTLEVSLEALEDVQVGMLDTLSTGDSGGKEGQVVKDFSEGMVCEQT